MKRVKNLSISIVNHEKCFTFCPLIKIYIPLISFAFSFGAPVISSFVADIPDWYNNWITRKGNKLKRIYSLT